MFKSGEATGIVKFVKDDTNFRFVSSKIDGKMEDVFVEPNLVTDDMLEGYEVTLAYFTTERGLAAREIISVIRPTFVVHGQVKWFDQKKGFGFVSRKNGKDIKITTESLGGYAGTIHGGASITLTATPAGKGWIEIVSVDEVKTLPTSDQFHVGKLVGVTVKDGSKFGFANLNVDGSSVRVYLHADVAMDAGTDIWNGHKIGMRYELTSNGAAVVEVCSPEEVETRNAEQSDVEDDTALAAE